MEMNGTVADGVAPGPEIKAESKPSTRASSPSPQDAKAVQILDACRWKDTETLRTLAVSEGGLISDELRRQACNETLYVLQPNTDSLFQGLCCLDARSMIGYRLGVMRSQCHGNLSQAIGTNIKFD